MAVTIKFEAMVGATPAWADIGAHTLVFSGTGGLAETIAADAYQDETHLGDGTPGDDQCGANHANNVKFISSTEMQVNGGATEDINDTNLAEAECSIRVHFNDSVTARSIKNARLYCYDGTTVTDEGVGVDMYAFERGVTATAWTHINDDSGNIGGDNTGERLDLGAKAAAAQDQYWYVALSAGPESAGAKQFSVGTYLEYY